MHSHEMTRAARAARALTAAALVALGSAIACGPRGEETEGTKAMDSAAPAPATVITPSHPQADSTAGVSQRTGRPHDIAGDTTGGKGTQPPTGSAGGTGTKRP